jgi:putative SOS response-associated peptidase YedK
LLPWRHREIPRHICLRDGDGFGRVGPGDRWVVEGEALNICSSIVIPANKVMKLLHERMPAIIAPAQYDLLLDTIITDKAVLIGRILIRHRTASW